ncbi:hypothetical protein Tco_0885919 [Tanacetum coccineum]
MYKEYLAEFCYSAKSLENSKVSFSIPSSGIYGKVGVNTFRNAIGAHYLPHSSKYVAPPSINIVRPWFITIGYGETVLVKGTLKKSLLPPKWRLLMAKIIQCLRGKTRGFYQITNKDAIILSSLSNGINIDYAIIFWENIIIKLNKRHREKVVPYTRFLSLLMMHKMKEGYGDGKVTPYPTQVFSVNNWALKPNQLGRTSLQSVTCTKPRAKLGHKKHSISLKQPSVSSKEATKGRCIKRVEATGGPTSLGVTSEERAYLNSIVFALGCDASADSTAKLDPRLSALNDYIPQQQDLDLPEDDPVIVVDDSNEDEEDELTNQVLILQSQKHKLELEKNKDKVEAALLKVQPSFPNVGQLNELLIKSLQTEFSKILSAHDFSSLLPIELKDLPSKFNELAKEVKGRAEKNAKKENLNNQQPKLIPSIITTTTQMQSAFQSPPKGSSQPKGEHIKKDNGKKAMSSDEAKAEKESTNNDSNDETHVTGSMVESSRIKKLKKFDFITEDERHIHITEEEINHQNKLEEDAKAEAAKQEGEVRKVELVDLLGPEVVNKVQISLKILLQRGGLTSKVILNFKASDLHLGVWREVVKACPNKTGKGWKTIYGHIQIRMDYLHTTKAELGINLDIPLSEQDPIDKLNDLAKQKETCSSSASALQVLRRLGSIFTSVYAAVQKLKKDSWKELQFSLVDNSKLNVVYLLNRS